jgi:pimeloyl-ACP methyl ester carboxylesterase
VLAIRTSEVELPGRHLGKHRDKVRPTLQKLRRKQFPSEASDAAPPHGGRVHTIVTVILVLTLGLPSLVRLAHAQDASSVSSVDHRSARSIADPCQDPLTPSALRETLRLVCSRKTIEPANRDIRKAIIVGFVGGFVKRDDIKHPEVLYARYLQNRYGSAVHAEVFGNHEEKRAVEDTMRRLDTDKDGFLTATEKEQAQIILYGHSWGASQTLTFARDLQRRGIPVALIIQIDSVKKFGQDNRTVPANVAKAVNFYQRKGLTRGQPLIVAADAGRTKILGNFHMKYEDHQVNCDNYRWLSRVFNQPHHQIENDPQVWNQIASFIDSELLRTDARTQTALSSESSVVK